MKIAVQCADLDARRIDGTRVYISRLLERFSCLGVGDDFFLYHRGRFNPALRPPTAANYHERRLPWSFPLWTQTRFAAQLFRDRPEVLWMPMHALPFLLPKDLRTVVTIHDLAFKIFPSHFTWRARRAQNILTDSAVARADRLIAVSAAAKRDILRFYPRLAEERVVVIEHGVDREFFAQKFPSERVDETLSRFDLRAGGYILYVGALQPRKNLRTLIAAFESLADDFGDLKLVLAGEVGWLAEGILRAVATSPFAERIVLTGGLPFEEVVILLQRATVFAFVPLYEGFGLPILEAFAAGTPVLTAENSSLPEVAAEAAEYCRAEEVASVEAGLRRLLADENLRNRLVAAGRKRVGRYDWDRCARRTLAVLHGEL